MTTRLVAVLDLNTGKFNTSLDGAERKAKGFGVNLAKIAGDATKAGIGGMLAFAGSSVKSAATAETAFAKLETVAGGDIASLKKQIMELPSNLGSVADAAAAAYEAISAGVPASKAVAFVTSAAAAAKGGFTDLKTAVDAGTTILNSYGEKAGSVTAIFDKFLVTQNLGKTTFDEMAPVIGRVAATAKETGISFNELLGEIAALTAGGVKTSESISAIKAAISNIQKPTKEAQGALMDLGFTVDGLDEDGKKVKAFADDAFRNFVGEKGLVGVIDLIKTKSPDAKKAIVDIFGSIEASTAANIMFGNLEKTKSFIDQVSNASGDAQKAADVMGSTFNDNLKTMWNSLDRIQIKLGEEFLPQVAGAAKVIADNIEIVTTALNALLAPVRMLANFGSAIGQGAGTVVALAKANAMEESKRTGLGKGVASLPGGQLIGAALGMQGFETTGAMIQKINAERAAQVEQRSTAGKVLGGLGPIGEVLGKTFGMTGFSTGGMVGPGGSKIPFLKMATGGVVPGTGNTDSVPILATPGEVVLPKGAVGSALPGAGGIAGGGFSSGAKSLPERVRAIFAKAAHQGTEEGFKSGATSGAGKGEGDSDSVFGKVFGASLKSSKEGLLSGILSGDVGGSIKDFGKNLANTAKTFLKQALMESLGKKIFKSLFGGGFGGFLAEGGPAIAGTPYVVGERGPEVFVPSASGTVVPNHAIGGDTISLRFGDINIGSGSTGMTSPRQMAREIMDEIEVMVRQRRAVDFVRSIQGAPA